LFIEYYCITLFEMKYTVLDIFSGCGGMSWGLQKSGFEIIAGIDEWTTALKTFQYNHENSKIFCDDIRNLKPQTVMESLGLKQGELSCLVGGPPCQGFSKNVPASYRFLADERNQLFNSFIDYVACFLPSVVVMENVAEIYNAFNGAVRNEIISQLVSLGYHVEVKVLFAPDYGIPQQRRRCFFIGSRTGKKPNIPQPTHKKKSSIDIFSNTQKYLSAWEAISDLPKLDNGEGTDEMNYINGTYNTYQKLMRNGNSILSNHKAKALTEIQLERVKSLKAGEGLKELPAHLRPKSGYSGAYGRLDFEMLAPTITRWVFHPGSGRFCHPQEDRLLTIREVARLQSFSDDFRFLGTYTEQAGQLGNAVPPLLMFHLATTIKHCLEGER
jgi:DNA (cytosine-5)-methyltransferase 1